MKIRITYAAMLALCTALLAGTPRAAPALVTPVFLLPYASDAKFIDYRPAINAAGTRIVFERTLRVPGHDAYETTTNLYIVDLDQPPPQRLVPGTAGSTRPDWCWLPSRPNIDGPIAFSNADGVSWITPVSGSAPQYLRNSSTWSYPTWFPGCGALAVDATRALPYGTHTGPATLQVNPVTGFFEKALSGRMQWAGFPSIDPPQPRLIAFAGQQFTQSGYDQDQNYIYIADNTTTPPRVWPLDQALRRQPWQSAFDPAYQGRAPTWSPDGQWIAFESNRACSDKNDYSIFIEDAQGSKPAQQVTDCSYNAQHPKWYRALVKGRNLLIASVMLYPRYAGTDPLWLNARGIASLDVTAFIANSR